MLSALTEPGRHVNVGEFKGFGSGADKRLAW